MNYKIFITAAAFMGMAVILGALGAHALEKHLTTDLLQSFETGVRYQVYHGLALFVISTIYSRLHPSRIRWSVGLMIAGTVCFSGSIYSFALGHLVGWSVSSILWWVTPLGGLLLIGAWVFLISAVIHQINSSSQTEHSINNGSSN